MQRIPCRSFAFKNSLCGLFFAESPGCWEGRDAILYVYRFDRYLDGVIP